MDLEAANQAIALNKKNAYLKLLRIAENQGTTNNSSIDVSK